MYQQLGEDLEEWRMRVRTPPAPAAPPPAPAATPQPLLPPQSLLPSQPLLPPLSPRCHTSAPAASLVLAAPP